MPVDLLGCVFPGLVISVSLGFSDSGQNPQA